MIRCCVLFVLMGVMVIGVNGDYCNTTNVNTTNINTTNINTTNVNIDQKINDTSLCNLCIEIGDLIQGVIKVENATVEIIEKMVEGLCELIGGEVIHQECCVIINLIQYLFNLVNSGVSPTQACQILHFCPTDVHIDEVKHVLKIKIN